MSCFRFVLFLQILPHFIQLHVLPVAQPRDMCGRLMAHCSSSILMLSSSKLAKEIGRKSLQSDSISYIIKLQLCLEKPFKNKKSADCETHFVHISTCFCRRSTVAWTGGTRLWPGWWTWSSAGDCMCIPQNLKHRLEKNRQTWHWPKMKPNCS